MLRTSDCRAILRSAVGLRDCAPCLCDLDGSGGVLAADALVCLRSAVGLEVTLSCPECTTTTTTTTTTTLPDPCPGSVEWTTRGAFGASCAGDGDCEAGVCDPAKKRCRTDSRLDIGWTGLQHGGDLNDGDVLKLKLDCDSAGPTCGQCAIAGVNPTGGNCRCANDLRKTCSEPFAASSSECGGAECRCYAGAPLPVVGAAPTCFVVRFESAPTGTLDVDSGEMDVQAPMRWTSHLGLSVDSPCPVCGGHCANAPSKGCVSKDDCEGGANCTFDPAPRDGERGGTCVGGAADGLSCDVEASNASLPEIWGQPANPAAGYSLDCPPSVGTNTSGVGARVKWRESTSAAQLPAKLSCGGQSPDLDCPCLACSGDTDTACQSDADCAGQQGRCSLATALPCEDEGGCLSVNVGPCRTIGTAQKCDKLRSLACTANSDCAAANAGSCTASTCSSSGGSVFPQPNACDDGNCADGGRGHGTCATGPDDLFCNNSVAPDGSGVLFCASNSDCWGSAIPFAAGNECSLQQRRECLAGTVTIQGHADPRAPLTGAALCMPPFGSAGTRESYGLPGPARLQRQGTLRALCASDPSREYVPGVGGCLD